MSDSKIINVTRASLPPLSEYEELLQHIWDTAWLTHMGEYHETLRAKLQDYLKVGSVQLFVNGHSALEFLLQAMDLHGEVITTPFSFASTTHAIVRNGLTPVFCDINMRDYTIDVDQLESLIDHRAHQRDRAGACLWKHLRCSPDSGDRGPSSSEGHL